MDRSKPHVQAFVILPETEPQYFYIKDEIGYQTEDFLQNFIKKLSICKKLIEVENYQGYYDSENIKHFIKHYDILEDFYPSRPSSVLRSQLKSWVNWRDERYSIEDYECSLLGRTISDETFSEVAIRREVEEVNNHVIVSHEALNIPLGKTHPVEFLGKTYVIPCIAISDLPNWFSENRLPQRNYHPSPKHGENGIGEWLGASKLYCSHTHAQSLLLKSIGQSELDELYFYDEMHRKYIIYRFEGDNTLNQYHAYHIEDDDVPKSIKELHIKLRELTQND